jgi:hypothetical protein
VTSIYVGSVNWPVDNGESGGQRFVIPREASRRAKALLEEVSLVTAARSSALARRLARLGASIAAITGLLENVAGLLRQLVQVAGWLLLLVGCVGLFFHPHLSIAYLATPGGGALAVLQGFIRLRGHAVTMALADAEADVVSELPGEASPLPAEDA